MSLNRGVNVLQAAAFGWIFWDEIKSLVNAMDLAVRLPVPDELNALREELDALDPNTTKGLAWKSISLRTPLISKHMYTHDHGHASQPTQAHCACSAFGQASHTHT